MHEEGLAFVVRGYTDKIKVVLFTARGAIAQLGERIVRNDEVVGSIPTSSTMSNPFPVACIPVICPYTKLYRPTALEGSLVLSGFKVQYYSGIFLPIMRESPKPVYVFPYEELRDATESGSPAFGDINCRTARG